MVRVAAARVFAGHGPSGALFLVLALVAVAVVATWVHLIGGISVGLAGRGWRIVVVSLLVAWSWLPFIYVAFWLGTHPQWRAWLPAVAGAVVALKVLLATRLVPAVVRDGHATLGEVAVAAVAWTAFVAGCGALIAALALPGRMSFAAAVLVVAVLVPFNRVVAAPLLLARNRHG